MRIDKEALLCDLAETYQVYDYKSLPASTVAMLAAGLRDDSRIKLKLAGQIKPFETLLLAGLFDKITLLLWSKTKAAEKGVGRPKGILPQLLGLTNTTRGFNTPEEFEEARRKILES